MRRVDAAVIVGLVLIGIGILVLLGNLNILPISASLIFALIFAVAGFAFVGVFLSNFDIGIFLMVRTLVSR
jgi:hypothetical protein